MTSGKMPYDFGTVSSITTLFGGGGAGVGGWVEVARTTLTSPVLGSTGITVSSIPNKRYYMVISKIAYTSPGGTIHHRVGYGSVDSSSNYSYRASVNGGTDFTGTNTTFSTALVSGTQHAMKIDFIANKSNKEKLFIEQAVFRGGSGSSSAPNRGEQVFKWVNTTNPINVIQGMSSSGGGASYTAGSEIIVLGWDPADEHTTDSNFWEEIGTQSITNSKFNLTIPARKYLWVQIQVKGNSGNQFLVRFNSDSSNSYSDRYSTNGGADGTTVNYNCVNIMDPSTPTFFNWFILNDSSLEKLIMSNALRQQTAGAGNSVTRNQYAGKWTNTSSQITNISSTGSLHTHDGIIKVWGAD